MLVLVTYDISLQTAAGQRRLRQVAKCCLNFGTRVQNSVFECVVDQTQYTRLKHELLGIIDPAQDSIRLYQLGDRYTKKVEHFGVKPGLKVEELLVF